MKTRENHYFRSIALRTTSAVAILAGTLLCSHTVSAQTTGDTANSAVEQVVVSGTRVVRDGYNAPTPTTVLGSAEIEANAPANVADYLNELPTLAPSQTPRTEVGFVSAGLTGINALNLRDIGANRTLVLLDGQRVGASTLSGIVDVNDLPEQLIKRVDVVTGGGSADWGSDAVSGVVNFILDKDFTGLKGQLQGGLTTYGDDANYKGALTWGDSFLNNRGHILLSVEAGGNDGIKGVPRPWANVDTLLFTNPAATTTNGLPQYLTRSNSGFATASPGGIITSGPLKGTYFGPGGTPTQFNYGPIVSGNFMQGGQSQYTNFGTAGDLDARIARQNVFLRTSYEVTDHFQIFGEASYASTHTSEASLTQFNFANITIQPDNAFIPSNLPVQTAPFTLGSTNQDLGTIPAISHRSAKRFVIGADGDFDAFGSNWTWKGYGQRGITDIYNAAQLTVTANYNAAIDSVRNSSGAITCRSTLTNPTNGCVPYDIFGTGVNNSSAVNYVRGTAFGTNKLTQDVVSFALNGNPISDWAGPISVATGMEYRREAVSGTSDALDASALAANIAAVAAGSASPPSSSPYFAGNYHPSFGSYNVTEGFFETVVPLAKDAFLAKSLDFEGAVRETGYSSSGLVTTYKLGLTYAPVDDVSFRVTRSHDIRAPNLQDLFQFAQTSTTSVTDPTRGSASSTVFQVTSGNLKLQPEASDTTGAGVVLKPSFLPGFEASVDYYEINIGSAIFTATAQQTITLCAQGSATACSGIVRNGVGVITQVNVQPFNLASQVARGWDFESSYRRDLAEIAPFLSGDFGLRFLATRYVANVINNGTTPAYNTVGDNSSNGTAQLSLPRWRLYASATWDKGPAAVTIAARAFSAGVNNTTYIQCTTGCPAYTAANPTIENNHLPGALYFDTNLAYDVPSVAGAKVYLAVDNIFNVNPPPVPFGPSIGTAPLSVNPALYDVLGRNFRFGVRFEE